MHLLNFFKKQTDIPEPSVDEILFDTDTYSYIISRIDEYVEKFQNEDFNIIVNELKLNLSERRDDINKNPAYTCRGGVNIKSAERLLLQFLREYVDTKLLSGYFHAGKGVLNNAGIELLHLYKDLSKDLIKLGLKDVSGKKRLDKQWLKKDFNKLRNDLKSVG